MTIGSIPVARGCGKRVFGGVYFECGTSPWGREIEEFLIDPPIPVDTHEMGISAQGVKVILYNGLYHVADWVGRTGYPNPTDDIEECRRFGMSARGELPTQEDYQKLTVKSRVLRIHSRAYLNEPARRALWEHRVGMGNTYNWTFCPTSNSNHNDLEQNLNITTSMCIGLLWENVTPITKDDTISRKGTRTMPSFTYECVEGFGFNADEAYQPAIYMALPITRIVVINDPETGLHEKKLKKLEESNFPVELVDE